MFEIGQGPSAKALQLLPALLCSPVIAASIVCFTAELWHGSAQSHSCPPGLSSPLCLSLEPGSGRAPPALLQAPSLALFSASSPRGTLHPAGEEPGFRCSITTKKSTKGEIYSHPTPLA